MDGKYTQYRRKINYYETDKMGVVHHANHIRYFEEARLDLMEKNDLDYAAMEKRGIVIPVMFAQAQYKKPLYYGECITISTAITKFDGIKMEFYYEIFVDGEDDLRVTGQTGHCFLDTKLSPVRLKRNYPDLYEKLNRLVGK